ncbi:MAG: gliding-motility protein MglA, partial [Leptolyngbya sp.]|nr:gliding-motility protein MglA [Candidatus Melainabacteria bacterium]
LSITKTPIVFQCNKRDLIDAMSVESMEADLNAANFPAFEAIAVEGKAVFSTLKKLSQLIIERQ